MTELTQYQTIEDFNVPVSGRTVKAKVTRFSYGEEYPSGVDIPEIKDLLLYTEGLPKKMDKLSIGLGLGPGGKTIVTGCQITVNKSTESRYSFVMVELQDTVTKSTYILSALEYFYETPAIKDLPEDTRIEYRDIINGVPSPFLVMTVNGCRLVIPLKEVKTMWGFSRVIERKNMLTQALVGYLHGLLDKAHDNNEVDGLRISIHPNNTSDLLDEILSYGLEVVVGGLNISRHPNGSDQYIIRRENDYYVVAYHNKYGFSYIIDALAKLNG